MSVGPGGSPRTVSKAYYNIKEVEATHTDKAIVQLMKEHNKLKKRLDVVSQPDYLINLKRDLRITEEEMKQQERLKRQLKVD